MHADFWHERWQTDRTGFHRDTVNPGLVDHWPLTEPAGRFTRWRYQRLDIICGDFFDLDRSMLGDLDAVYGRATLIAMRPRHAAHLAGLAGREPRQLLITLEYNQLKMTVMLLLDQHMSGNKWTPGWF